MMNIDILLKRYNTIRKAWTNSRTPEEEQEWYDKLQIIEKEIKAFKARNNSNNTAANTLERYIQFVIKENKDAEGSV